MKNMFLKKIYFLFFVTSVIGCGTAPSNSYDGPATPPNTFNPENPYDPNSAIMQQLQKAINPAPEPTGLLPFLANMVGDVSTIGLRNSQSGMARDFGAMGKTTAERAAERQANIYSTTPPACPSENHQGCCSYHGGMAGCMSYRVVCNDGTYSLGCFCNSNFCQF